MTDPAAHDDDLAARERRGKRLIYASVACGVITFVIAAVISAFAASITDGTFGANILVSVFLFAVFLALTIVLGYVGARTRPPRDEV